MSVESINKQEAAILEIIDAEEYKILDKEMIEDRIKVILPYYNEWQKHWEEPIFFNYIKTLGSIRNELRSLDFSQYDNGLNGRISLAESFMNKIMIYRVKDVLNSLWSFDEETQLKIKNLINWSLKKYYIERERIINKIQKIVGIDRKEIEELKILSFLPIKNPSIGEIWMSHDTSLSLNDLIFRLKILLCIDNEFFLTKNLKGKIGQYKYKQIVDGLYFSIIQSKLERHKVFRVIINRFNLRYNLILSLSKHYNIFVDTKLKDLSFKIKKILCKNYQFELSKTIPSYIVSILRKRIDKIDTNRNIVLLTEKEPTNGVFHFFFFYNEDLEYLKREIKVAYRFVGGKCPSWIRNIEYNSPEELIIVKEEKDTRETQDHSSIQLLNNSISNYNFNEIISKEVRATDLVIKKGIISYNALDGNTYSLKSVRIPKLNGKFQICLDKIDHLFTLVKDKTIYEKGMPSYRFHFEPANDLSFLLSELERLKNPEKVDFDFQFPLEGEFQLPWKFVRFQDGLMYLIHPNPSKRGTVTPFHFRHPDILKSFRHILPYIESRCAPLKVVAADGLITQLVNFDELKNIIPQLKEWTKDRGIEYVTGNKKRHTKAYTKEAFNKIVQKIKSPYLEYLSRIQLSDYKIYYLLERVVHTGNLGSTDEYGYLFTVNENKLTKEVKLIYENITDNSRASIIFTVKLGFVEEARSRIALFLASEIENKRQKLAWRKIQFSEHYIKKIERLNHTYLSDWKYYFKFYL